MSAARWMSLLVALCGCGSQPSHASRLGPTRNPSAIPAGPMQSPDACAPPPFNVALGCVHNDEARPCEGWCQPTTTCTSACEPIGGGFGANGWRVELPASFAGAVRDVEVTPQGRIYACGARGVVAVDPEGRVLWTVSTTQVNCATLAARDGWGVAALGFVTASASAVGVERWSEQGEPRWPPTELGINSSLTNVALVVDEAANLVIVGLDRVPWIGTVSDNGEAHAAQVVDADPKAWLAMDLRAATDGSLRWPGVLQPARYGLPYEKLTLTTATPERVDGGLTYSLVTSAFEMPVSAAVVRAALVPDGSLFYVNQQRGKLAATVHLMARDGSETWGVDIAGASDGSFAASPSAVLVAAQDRFIVALADIGATLVELDGKGSVVHRRALPGDLEVQELGTLPDRRVVFGAQSGALGGVLGCVDLSSSDN